MEELPVGNIQQLLMTKIKSMLPAHISLAEELADLLGLSTDSAYRRIRGEKALSIDEIIEICRHFRISFDSLVATTKGAVSFNFVPVNSRAEFLDYLTDIRDDLKMINRAPDKHIYYAAVDIPIFHLFKYPECFYFKMFYWLHSVVNDPDFAGKRFSISAIEDEIVQLCREIADLYACVPSTELWSDSILNSVIKQVDYYWQSGLFEAKQDALALLGKIQDTLHLVSREAELGGKYLTTGQFVDFNHRFFLYRSDIEIGNNCIIVNVGNAKRVYNSFHTFNKMFTTNMQFCEQSAKWLDNLLKKATLISGVAEKHRFQFFSGMMSQIEDLRGLISGEKLVEA